MGKSILTENLSYFDSLETKIFIDALIWHCHALCDDSKLKKKFQKVTSSKFEIWSKHGLISYFLMSFVWILLG